MLERLRLRWWRLTVRSEAEDGLTLIEVMIAGFVLATAVLALASVASASLVSLRDSRERDRATAAASSALEAARSLDYDDIALLPGGAWTTDPLVQASAGGYEFDRDGDGSVTEELWASATGAIEPYVCSSADADSCWFDMPTDARVVVRTFVSWYVDADGDRTARRVTAIADWEDPAFTGTRTVRMSTLIAPSTSGLPAPAFEVIPERLTTSLDEIALDQSVDPAHEDGPYGICFEHTLTNYGAPDHYDVMPDSDEGWMVYQAESQGTWRNEEWLFRAFFVPHGEERDADTLMLADPETGGQSLDSPTGLDTGESAGIHFCYERRAGNGDGTRPNPAGSPYKYQPTVRSKFDPEVQEHVEHEIEIVPALRLYLHYELDEVGELLTYRPVRARGEVTISANLLDLEVDLTVNAYLFDRFSMSPDPPPVGSSLPSYDVEIYHEDADELVPIDSPPRLGRPGLFLPRETIPVGGILHTAQMFAAEWDYHFDVDAAPITVDDAQIHLWATRFGGEEPRATAEYCVAAQLVKFEMQPDGSFADTPTVVGEVTRRFPVPDQDTNAPQGFRKLTVPPFTVPLNGQPTFKEGDALRLRIWNAGSLLSGVDCVTFHIGFGLDREEGGDPSPFAATLDLTSEAP